MPTQSRPHDNLENMVTLGVAMMKEREAHKFDDQRLRIEWDNGGHEYAMLANVNRGAGDYAAYLYRNDDKIRESHLPSPDELRQTALALVQRETGVPPNLVTVEWAAIETGNKAEWTAIGTGNNVEYPLSGMSKYALKRQYLKYTERDKFSTIRLRSRDLADHRVYQNAATRWTLPVSYKGVQKGLVRRVPTRLNTEATTRSHLLAYMSLFARRAPSKPRALSDIQLLWRGIHGVQAAAFLATGRTSDTGFVATSYNKRIAERFTGYDDEGWALLCLPVKHVPRGTPWVWFDHDVQSTQKESEVLLPPGTLQSVSHEGDYWMVKYTQS